MNPEALLQRLAEVRREGNMIMQQLEAMGLPRQQVVSMIQQAEAPQRPPQAQMPQAMPQGMPQGMPQEMPQGMPQGLLG